MLDYELGVVSGWIIVYPTGISTYLHASRQAAEKEAYPGAITIVEVQGRWDPLDPKTKHGTVGAW